MFNNKITLIFTHRKLQNEGYFVDKYVFNNTKFSNFIKKYLLKFKVIRQLLENYISTTSYTFDFDNIDLELLNKAISSYHITTGDAPKAMYIGKKQLSQLLKDPRILTDDLWVRTFSLEPKMLLGLKLIVVPYMDGVMIV